MSLVTSGIGLILRMRRDLNKIRSNESLAERAETEEIKAAEKGSVDGVKTAFNKEMEALHKEIEEVWQLSHQENLWVSSKLDVRFKNAITLLDMLGEKGFPENELQALAQKLDEVIEEMRNKLKAEINEATRLDGELVQLSGQAKKAA